MTLYPRLLTSQTPRGASCIYVLSVPGLGKQFGWSSLLLNLSVCVPFPSDKVTKSPISGGGENDALPSSSAAPTVGAGGLISPGKGQKDRET